MSDIVNYGIIGCGMMGQEHLRNIALIPGTRAAAIFEPDQTQAARAHAIAPGAQFYASVSDLLTHPTLDCLLVASPNDLHVAQFEQIARTRPLPLLMEKPLFTASADRARLDRIVSTYAPPVWVAMEYRYMPPIQALLEQTDKVTGGPLMLTIREHRFPFLDKVGDWNRFNARSGGTLVEKCCHFFDLMRLILRDEPVRIMASASQMVNHKTESYQGRTPDIWDSGYVIVDFKNGARAMLELCMFAEGGRYQEEITVTGPAGRVEAFVPGPGRFWPAELGPAPVPVVTISPRSPKGPRDIALPVDPSILDAGDHNGSTFYQHRRFIAALRGQGPVEVTFQDGARAVEMGLAAQRAAETGQPVAL